MSDFFNGGTPGAVVPIGQYIADWYTSLGATLAVLGSNRFVSITMPSVNGIPAPVPQELQALTTNYDLSLFAWVSNGSTYPPAATCSAPFPYPFAPWC